MAMQEEPALRDEAGTQEEPEMVAEVMRVWRPAGQVFSRSQKVPGRYSPSTRVSGSRKLSEATLEPLAENEQVVAADAPQPTVQSAARQAPDHRSRRREEVEDFFIDAAVHLGHRLIERGTPILMSLIVDRAIPAATSKVKHAFAARKARRQSTTAPQNITAQENAAESDTAAEPDNVAAPQTCLPPAPVEVGHEVGAAIGAQMPVIGREEALHRIEMRRAALLFAAEQERILRQSVVVDDVDLLQLDGAAVAQEQLGADAQLKLEAAPSPASDGRLVSLSDVLGTEPDPQEGSRVKPDRRILPRPGRPAAYPSPGQATLLPVSNEPAERSSNGPTT